MPKPSRVAIAKTFQPLSTGAPLTPRRHMIGGCVEPTLRDGKWIFTRWLLHATKGWRKA